MRNTVVHACDARKRHRDPQYGGHSSRHSRLGALVKVLDQIPVGQVLRQISQRPPARPERVSPLCLRRASGIPRTAPATLSFARNCCGPRHTGTGDFRIDHLAGKVALAFVQAGAGRLSFVWLLAPFVHIGGWDHNGDTPTGPPLAWICVGRRRKRMVRFLDKVCLMSKGPNMRDPSHAIVICGCGNGDLGIGRTARSIPPYRPRT